jgi:hypothetical protein
MKVRYQRRNNVILDVRSESDRTTSRMEDQIVDDKIEKVEVKTVDPIEPPRVFKSINLAKKESIKLQKKYGAGCLRVDKDAPPLYPARFVKARKKADKKPDKPEVTASPRTLRLGDALAMVAAAITRP